MAVLPAEPTVQPAIPLPPVSQAGTMEERVAAADASALKTQTDMSAHVAGQGIEKSLSDVAFFQEVMRKIQAGEKIDPDTLSKLPHDIAVALAEKGATLSPEETVAVQTNGQAAVVRLPESQMMRMRDRDGLPTVTETNVWAGTKDRIILPLPGGGDIMSKEDFEAFKLEG
jgi:hypothetical protein